MLRQAVVLVVLVFAGAVRGQSAGLPRVESTAELAQWVATAREEVLLAVPVLRSQLVADALREAMVVRGVEVYLLSTVEGVQDRASYLAGLALAGARLRLHEVSEGVLVRDRQELVTGPLLAALDATTLAEPSVHSRDAREVHAYVSWFYEVYRASPVMELHEHMFQGGYDDP